MRNFDQCAPNFRLGIDEAPRAWRPAGVVAAATPHRRQRRHGAIARATSSCINFSRLGRLKLHIIKSLC